MQFFNKKIFAEFIKTNEIFLKKNYYYIAQNYIINHIINKPNNIFNNFLEIYFQGLEEIIHYLGNMNNNDNPDRALIRENMEFCFKKKVKTFSMNNLTLNNVSFIQEKITDNYKFSKDLHGEHLISRFKKSDSLLFHKFPEIDTFNFIEKTQLDEDWFILEENEWKFLNDELKRKIKYFLEHIEYQSSSIVLKNDDNNFNYIQENIKNDLINFFNKNISQYFEEIFSYYNNNLKNNNNYIYEIEIIIKNENMDLFYQKEIKNYLNEYTKIININIIKHISVIVTGKTGVGKSTLINCLLKEYLAKEGDGDIVTTVTKTYHNEIIPFLYLTDTRGYEINEKFNPELIKNEVLS